jgi:hypothetical protein
MRVPTTIFIVPYRNRLTFKNSFEKHMKYLLEDIPKDTYEIFFIHQYDQRPFNRGAMKNIGFLAMRDKYPKDYKNITFVFNDVDTAPKKKNILKYNTKIGIVKHFYGFHYALGGIFSIVGADFEKTGGFSNNWGWGMEDNVMRDRVANKGIKIDRSIFFKIRDPNIIHLTNSNMRIMTKEEPWRYKSNSSDSFRDITNLKYNIENEYVQVKSFTTKYSPNNQTFYKTPTTTHLKLDKRFATKHSMVRRMDNIMNNR